MQCGVAQEPLEIAPENAMLGCIQNILKGTMFNKEKICTSDIVALWTLSYIYCKTRYM